MAMLLLLAPSWLPCQFSVNVNYFPNPALARENCQVLRRHVALMRQLGIRADYFFTWLAAKQIHQLDPDFFSLLKREGMGIHHHGANRPPRPMPIQRCRGENWEEDVKAIMEYETHDLDPVTGRLLPSVGGLKGMREVLGLQPFSTGRFFKAPILYVAKTFGIKMGVGLEDNVGAPDGRAWFMGILNRPETRPLTLVPRDIMRWAMGRGPDPRVRLERAVDEALREGKFAMLAVLVHDSDFIGKGRRPRPPWIRARFWAAYEAIVKWAVSNPKLKVVTLREVYQMAVDDRERELSRDAVVKTARLLAAEGLSAPPLFVNLGGDYLSLCDAFQAVCRSLAHYARKGTLPKAVKTRDLLGPTYYAEGISSPIEVDASELVKASADLEEKISDRIPAEVKVGRLTLNAAEYLHFASRVLVALAEGKRLDEISPLRLHSVNLLPEEVEANPKACPLTKLQFWTYKPARWKGWPPLI